MVAGVQTPALRHGVDLCVQARGLLEGIIGRPGAGLGVALLDPPIRGRGDFGAVRTADVVDAVRVCEGIIIAGTLPLETTQIVIVGNLDLYTPAPAGGQIGQQRIGVVR